MAVNLLLCLLCSCVYFCLISFCTCKRCKLCNPDMSFLKSYAANFFAYVEIILVTNEPLIRAWMNIPSVELGHNISSRELRLDKKFAGSNNACNNGV